MIDRFYDIYTAIAVPLRAKFPGINVSDDVSGRKPKFPSALIEETSNIDTQTDNAPVSGFADLQYRITVQSSKTDGRIAEARSILATVDAVMQSLNFKRTAMLTQSGLYNNSVYKIEATYRAAIDKNGTLYLRR